MPYGAGIRGTLPSWTPELLKGERAEVLRQSEVLGVVEMTGDISVISQIRERAIPESEDPVVLNPKMRMIYQTVSRVASHNIAVLVLGESGFGKEHVV